MLGIELLHALRRNNRPNDDPTCQFCSKELLDSLRAEHPQPANVIVNPEGVALRFSTPHECKYPALVEPCTA